MSTTNYAEGVMHTPGPWGVFGANDSSSGEWRALTVSQASMPFIRVCFMPSDGTENIMADARLIAAAPQILEALRILTAVAEKMPGCHGLALDNARAAMAAAEGKVVIATGASES